MLVTRDIEDFIMPVFYRSRCVYLYHVYTHEGHQQPLTLMQWSARFGVGGRLKPIIIIIIVVVVSAAHGEVDDSLWNILWVWLPPKTVWVSVQCTLLPQPWGLWRQPGKSVLASITQVRVVYTHRVPQREVSVSIYKLYLWKLCLLTGGTAWQHSRETGNHLAPPGAPLDAVHIAGCFKFLALEELSCVIFPPKRVLSSDWNTVGVLSFFVIWGMFSSRWKRRSVKAHRSEERTSEIVCLWLCFHSPFLGQRSWTNDATRRFLKNGGLFSPAAKHLQFPDFFSSAHCFLSPSLLWNTHKSESRAEDSFHNHQTCLQSQIKQMASALHKGHETESVGHLHCRGQASSENQYHLFKCDQETGALIDPWQWTNWERSAWLLSFGSQHEWGHYGFWCVAGRITSVWTRTDGAVWIL